MLMNSITTKKITTGRFRVSGRWKNDYRMLEMPGNLLKEDKRT